MRICSMVTNIIARVWINRVKLPILHVVSCSLQVLNTTESVGGPILTNRFGK